MKLNIHVPHRGHTERDKVRVLAEVDEVCEEVAKEGRKVILMMGANMDLSDHGRDRVTNLNAGQMDRLKTLVMTHEMITQQIGTPTWNVQEY